MSDFPRTEEVREFAPVVHTYVFRTVRGHFSFFTRLIAWPHSEDITPGNPSGIRERHPSRGLIYLLQSPPKEASRGVRRGLSHPLVKRCRR